MHLPFQKIKKNIVWGSYIDWDNRHFFPLYKQFTLFYLTNLYSAKKQKPHMFNAEYSKLYGSGSLNFFKGTLLNGHPGGFVFFQEVCHKIFLEAQFFLRECDLYRKCGMAVILLSFLYNYNNLALKLHQGKRSYPDLKRVSKSTMSMMQGHY